MGVTIDDARAIAAALPRSYEALVRDQVRFRFDLVAPARRTNRKEAPYERKE
jgi:hypothetical protein